MLQKKIKSTDGAQIIKGPGSHESVNHVFICSIQQVPPEPAEHVASMSAMPTIVTPGEPVVELGEFVLPRQVHLLI